MKAEIISVGNELLSGSVTNTDTSYLARALTEMGFTVEYQSTVPDERKKIQHALGIAVNRSAVIIFTGGLGPTPDDMTREAVCAAVGRELVLNKEVLEQIKEYFRQSGKHYSESNRKQALFPADAVIFPNARGTAAGFAMQAGNQHIILLPGPPAELKAVFEQGSVAQYLARYTDEQAVTRSVYVFGMGESHVAETIEKYLDRPNPYVATYVSGGEVEVRITAREADRREAQRKCDFAARDICKMLGQFAYSIDLPGLETVLVKELQRRGLTIATAESCTAGLVAKRITDIPGSSSVFKMGVIAYADAVKRQELGVSAQTLDEYTAVSGEVAEEMAIGAYRRSGASLAVSVTGVAGPGPDANGNPAGLVYVALTDGASCWVRKLNIRSSGGAREQVRLLAASNALDLARCYLQALPDVLPGGIPLSETRAHAVCAPAPVLQALQSSPAPQVQNEEIILLGPSDDEKDLDSDQLPLLNLSRPNAKAENPRVWHSDPAAPAASAKPAAPDRDLFSSSGAAPADPVPTQGREIDLAIQASFENETPAAPRQPARSAPAAGRSAQPRRDAAASRGAKPADRKRKKPGFWAQLAALVIPMRGDSGFELVRKIILILAILVVIGCLAALSVYGARSIVNDIVHNKTVDLHGSGADVDLDAIDFPAGADAVEFAALYAENSDTVGWIKIDNTKVDNVVVQTTDNSYYLDHTFYKGENTNGTIFLDARCTLNPNVRSQNLVLYGHHMRNGSMFGSLKNFRTTSFLQENHTISFNTLYSKDTYEIFAVLITNDYEEQDKGYRFDYNRPNFNSDEDFEWYISEIRKRSLYNVDVEVTAQDQLLTLSTCIYDFKEARLVVVARKLPAGVAAVSADKITRKSNKDVLFPQAWYDKKGGKKPSWAQFLPV